MKWITFAAAAALLAMTGACKSNGTGSGGSVNSRADSANSGGAKAGPDNNYKNKSQGRTAEPMPRGSSNPAVSNPSGGNSGGLGDNTTTTSGESSGLNADKGPATGTTPAGQGQTPSNGTGSDSASGSTNR